MNPLTDILPPKYRKAFYAAIFLVGLVYTIWQATDGDWGAFAVALIAALGGGTAASNTLPKRRGLRRRPRR